MASEKKAKTAATKEAIHKRFCPECGAESKVVQYTGYGPKGFFWVCDKDQKHVQPTR